MRSVRKYAAPPIVHLRNLPKKLTTVMCATKIEGVNRSRGEAAETIHHLYMAKEKGYLTPAVFESFRTRYKECIRMLNGLEKSLERKLPEGERRWVVGEQPGMYSDKIELDGAGWPDLKPET